MKVKVRTYVSGPESVSDACVWSEPTITLRLGFGDRNWELSLLNKKEVSETLDMASDERGDELTGLGLANATLEPVLWRRLQRIECK